MAARMTILPIVTIPDPVLRRRSRPVERFDDDLHRFLDSMLATMYDAPGIGLAAVQVGEPIRAVTIDCARRADDEEGEEKHERKSGPAEPLFFLNPEIVRSSDARNVYEEGCLSIPDYYAEVERPAAVTVRYQDRDGTPREIEADGILATCLQHEIDHLDGVLFVDHISRLKREMVFKRFTKEARRKGTVFVG